MLPPAQAVVLVTSVIGLSLLAEAAEAKLPVPNRAPLAARAFDPLPLTAIKPQGWLRRQLQLQASSLSGKLDEFWPSVGPDSGWLGGAGESWERGPYYMDGLIPMAFLLDDPALIQKAHKWVAWTLDHQREDGSIGPTKNTDWWPNMVMLKVLTQYQEATGDARVIPLMQRYVKYQLAQQRQRPLKEWAIYRWQDEAVALLWLYNRTGDGNALDLIRLLKEQGYDWRGKYEQFRFTAKTLKKDAGLESHVVNNAMGIKAPAVWSMVSNDRSDRGGSAMMLSKLDQYHGMPTGVFGGDEHLAGSSPVQGTELCAVVEDLYSLENVFSVTGDPHLGDRMEKIAYNALPGTFSPDMWAHQYDQQPNQIEVSVAPRAWTTNGPESNLYGLEPNFGCCTANFHQGWPKLIASLWMATPDHGLAAVIYGPNQVKTQVAGNVPVTITETTDYPFRSLVSFVVTPEKPVRFPLMLRIPEWATNAELQVNGKKQKVARAGEFATLNREWRSGDRVELKLPMTVQAHRGYQQALYLQRGPLVYSLKIAEDWQKLKQHGPAADWAVHPQSPWNYALALNESTAAQSVAVEEKPVGDRPFSPDGAPVLLTVKARRVEEWKAEGGMALAPPASPVTSTAQDESITLIPYGAAKLRITVFPELRAVAPDERRNGKPRGE